MIDKRLSTRKQPAMLYACTNQRTHYQLQYLSKITFFTSAVLLEC
jgi:hypothetical protein